jgi:hypothetical protein
MPRLVPLDLLFDIRTCGVHDVAQLLQDGLGPVGRVLDVGVDAIISSGHERRDVNTASSVPL